MMITMRSACCQASISSFLLTEYVLLWPLWHPVRDLHSPGVGGSHSLPHILPEIQCKSQIHWRTSVDTVSTCCWFNNWSDGEKMFLLMVWCDVINPVDLFSLLWLMLLFHLSNVSVPPTDPNRHPPSSAPQRDSVLPLCGRHLSWLLLLWLDRPGTLPCQGE